jgi:hypothetical protein
MRGGAVLPKLLFLFGFLGVDRRRMKCDNRVNKRRDIMNCQKIEVNARKSVFGFFGIAAVAVLGYCWEVTLVLLTVIAAIAAIVVVFIVVHYTMGWLQGEVHICKASRDAYKKKKEQEELDREKEWEANNKANKAKAEKMHDRLVAKRSRK